MVEKSKILIFRILEIQICKRKLSVISCNGQWSINKLNISRPPDNGAYLKVIFLISQQKFMLWVHKRILSEAGLLSTQNTCLN